MRKPLLILLMLVAVIGGLAFGALMGVIVIGLIVGLVAASIVGLAGWGAVRGLRKDARRIRQDASGDTHGELPGPRP